MKKTPLYNLHQKHGAKFVQFAGYEMPIQYETGIVKEHITTRNNSGIFDVSHMGQLFLKGGDELTNDLQKIFPIDLAKISINQSKYSFLMKTAAIFPGQGSQSVGMCKEFYDKFDLVKKIFKSADESYSRGVRWYRFS